MISETLRLSGEDQALFVTTIQNRITDAAAQLKLPQKGSDFLRAHGLKATFLGHMIDLCEAVAEDAKTNNLTDPKTRSSPRHSLYIKCSDAFRALQNTVPNSRATFCTLLVLWISVLRVGEKSLAKPSYKLLESEPALNAFVARTALTTCHNTPEALNVYRDYQRALIQNLGQSSEGSHLDLPLRALPPLDPSDKKPERAFYPLSTERCDAIKSRIISDATRIIDSLSSQPENAHMGTDVSNLFTELQSANYQQQSEMHDAIVRCTKVVNDPNVPFFDENERVTLGVLLHALCRFATGKANRIFYELAATNELAAQMFLVRSAQSHCAFDLKAIEVFKDLCKEMGQVKSHAAELGQRENQRTSPERG